MIYSYEKGTDDRYGSTVPFVLKFIFRIIVREALHFFLK